MPSQPKLSAAVRAELNSALDGPITVDITTIGRESGKLRRIEIWIVNIDGRVIICGTPRPRPRDWLANLLQDSRLIVHFKEATSTDVDATAIEVTDVATRRAVWHHRSTEWYRERTSVDTLIADGPTVELTWII
jgi:deazaflavin-dependent oxidoreductase (nitroreductase family)